MAVLHGVRCGPARPGWPGVQSRTGMDTLGGPAGLAPAGNDWVIPGGSGLRGAARAGKP